MSKMSACLRAACGPSAHMAFCAKAAASVKAAATSRLSRLPTCFAAASAASSRRSFSAAPLAARPAAPPARPQRRAHVTTAAGTDAAATAVASPGDYVECHYSVATEDGTVVDSSREEGGQQARFILGSSRLVAGFHQAVGGLAVGESRKGFRVAAEDAYGEKQDSLMASIPKSQAPAGLEAGMVVQLTNGMQAVVTAVDEQSVTIDANHPLAGQTLLFDVELTKRTPAAQLQTVAFGAGCFWGVELAFQRVPGVVQTAVGYSQGRTEKPTYEQVCSGTTGHNEVVQLVYDTQEVSLEQLLDVFWEKHDPTTLNRQGNDVGEQYRSGIYYTTEEQRQIAEASKAKQNEKLGGKVVTEIEEIKNFSEAEDYHQQYLEKGGRFGRPQSAAKGCTDPIRCYG